jgi:hypothetical protein
VSNARAAADDRHLHRRRIVDLERLLAADGALDVEVVEARRSISTSTASTAAACRDPCRTRRPRRSRARVVEHGGGESVGPVGTSRACVSASETGDTHPPGRERREREPSDTTKPDVGIDSDEEPSAPSFASPLPLFDPHAATTTPAPEREERASPDHPAKPTDAPPDGPGGAP